MAPYQRPRCILTVGWGLRSLKAIKKAGQIWYKLDRGNSVVRTPAEKNHCYAITVFDINSSEVELMSSITLSCGCASVFKQLLLKPKSKCTWPAPNRVGGLDDVHCPLIPGPSYSFSHSQGGSPISLMEYNFPGVRRLVNSMHTSSPTY